MVMEAPGASDEMVQVTVPSAAEVLQNDFACQSLVPDSIANSNWSEFCDPRQRVLLDQLWV
jgi:hypothetical protein